MPKKKRRPRKNHNQRTGPNRAHRTEPNQSARLLTAFRTSRIERGLDPDDAWIIEILMDLKQKFAGITDPAVWLDQDTYELFTEVVPRQVHVHPQDWDRVVPTLEDFFTFLHDRGRWSPHSLPFEDVPNLIRDLRRDVPTALADPQRRGMTGNIIQYAMSQGIDPTDNAAMAEFFEWYNALDHERRVAISDTGQAPPSTGSAPQGAAFGLSPEAMGTAGAPPVPGSSAFGGPATRAPGHGSAPEEFDSDDAHAFDLTDWWPDFLGDPPDPETGIKAMDSADPRDLLDTELTRRADRVMALLGDGRKLTKTGALTRADTACLLSELGIEQAPRSMWDVPALAYVWVGLQSAGFIDLQGNVARPDGKPAPWAGPDGDPRERLLTVRLLHAVMLTILLGTEDREGAMVSTLVTPALLKATEPDGLTIDEPTDLDKDDAGRARDLIVDLSLLYEAGLIERDTDGALTFYAHPSLLELTPAGLEAATEDAPEA